MITVAIIFIVLGILTKYGKMHSLIAGYNTMSKQKSLNMISKASLQFSEMRCLEWL
jgi:hypothetical protein